MGETLADLNRRQDADIEWDLLRLKRSVLADKLEQTKLKLVEETKLEIANHIASLSSRGLGNSTIVTAFQLNIEKQAAVELDRMVIEYNRAIEEIAYLDRKVSVLRLGFWQRAKRCISKLVNSKLLL